MGKGVRPLFFSLLFSFGVRTHLNQNTLFPFPILTTPKRRWLPGLVISLFGHVVFSFGFLCLAAVPAYIFVLPVSFFADPQLFYSFVITVPIVVPGVAALPMGAHLVLYGRRMRAKDALTVLSKDPRAPVLYLRSFDDEDLPDPTFRGGSFRNPFIPQRYEQAIVSVLRRVGPVISIGIPRERRAELGAARLYVDDEHWRPAVQYFVQNSAAIVIVMGRTQSLWWEVDFVLSNAQRERLLFFFPHADEPSARRTYWRKYWEILPRVLPRPIFERMQAERQDRYNLLQKRTQAKISGQLPEQLGDAHFLDFRDDLSPRLLPTKRPIIGWFYSFIFPKSVSTWVNIRATLRPFVEKIGRLKSNLPNHAWGNVGLRS